MDSAKKWLKGWISREADEPQNLDKYSAHRKFKVGGELYVPGRKVKEKICKFIVCEFTFDIHNESSHAIRINNLLHDPCQENEEYCIIPINSELEFASYIGYNMDDEEVRGFSFYNKKKLFLFQSQINKEEADRLEYYTAQLLFEAKTGKDFTSATKSELIEYCK